MNYLQTHLLIQYYITKVHEKLYWARQSPILFSVGLVLSRIRSPIEYAANIRMSGIIKTSQFHFGPIIV